MLIKNQLIQPLGEQLKKLGVILEVSEDESSDSGTYAADGDQDSGSTEPEEPTASQEPVGSDISGTLKAEYAKALSAAVDKFGQASLDLEMAWENAELKIGDELMSILKKDLPESLSDFANIAGDIQRWAAKAERRLADYAKALNGSDK